MSDQETPIQEAVSLITITAILVAVCVFVGGLNGVPLIETILIWIAGQVYEWIPLLYQIETPRLTLAVGAAAIGVLVWILAIPFCAILAQAFAVGQMYSLDRQTRRLQRNRAKIEKIRRDRDGFNVS